MGNKSSNIIEINGKRYDAVSGSLLGTTTTAAQSGQVSGFSIDGFTRTRGQSTHTDLTSMAERAQKEIAFRKAHTQAAHAVAHQPEPAKTLMRSVVKKPDLKATTLIKVQSQTNKAVAIPAHEVPTKLSVASVDPNRQKRAERIIQSSAVSRFGKASGIDAIAPFSPSLHLTPTPAKASPLPMIPVQDEAKSVASAKQSDIFATTLAGVTGHQQARTDKKPGKRGRLALATSVSLIFLLVIGIFAYTNIPAISLRMASAKAGFQAKLPSYSPAGFNFGTMSYGPGNVTVSYKNASMSDQQFAIEQRISGWDDNALLNNFVASANKAYQTYQRSGHTVYLYGDNTATWVNNGIWYTVDGGSSLTRSQLLQLASSL